MSRSGELVAPDERAQRTRCRCCGQVFSDANVFSDAGWIETRISGLCEVCFDTVADLIEIENLRGGHDGG
ncbi:hypothetical protein OKW41_002091 [Paraburkholderia sp. UCT70]